MSGISSGKAAPSGSANPGSADNRKNPRTPLDRQRSEFLRSCRARLQPGDLGLPAPQRKRTLGLRREDVAALSGVSVAWYTWLEQGREMRVSEEVLERICHTFKLSEHERVYLFSLVQHRPPRPQHDAEIEVPAEILRVVEGIAVPAIVLNLRWDVLAWNRLNSLIYRDYGAMPAAERNLIELLFTRPSHYKDPAGFEDMAQRVLAKMRVDYSNSGGDPKFEALIRRLETVSPIFRRVWRNPEINPRSYGTNRFIHEHFGPLSFEHTSYVPDGHRGIRVVLCMPQDDATRKVLLDAQG